MKNKYVSTNKPRHSWRILLKQIVVLFLFSAILFGCDNPSLNYENESITIEMLQAAENIADISFTDRERKEILERVTSNTKTYKNFREQHLNYYSYPSMVFNPLPAGYTVEHEQKPLNFSEIKIQRPENTEDLAFYSILQLAELIKTHQITSLELTELYLSRLKKYNGKLKCAVTITEDLAIKQAKKADKEIGLGNYKGLLHGIPYGIKDLFSVKGYETTWGTEVFEDRIIDFDATVVQKLEEAGAEVEIK